MLINLIMILFGESYEYLQQLFKQKKMQHPTL